jgi:hypothetical protein
LLFAITFTEFFIVRLGTLKSILYSIPISVSVFLFLPDHVVLSIVISTHSKFTVTIFSFVDNKGNEKLLQIFLLILTELAKNHFSFSVLINNLLSRGFQL